MTVLEEIQIWYQSQCDGEWEHDYGIEIGTLDNPGWYLKVDLTGTHLSDIPFDEIKNEASDNDWIHCRVENGQFAGYGGPQNLEHVLGVFLNWAKSDKGWLQSPVYESIDDENQQFWKSLSLDVQGETCKVEDCNNERIQYSVLCRHHHFAKYKQQ